MGRGYSIENQEDINEFGIEGALYYAVAEAGYNYSARQDKHYGSRKYNTLTAAEAALVATPTTVQVINIVGPWSSPEENSITIDTVATTEENYVAIRAIGEARHKGVWSETAWRTERTTLECININIQHCRLDGLQTKFTSSDRTFDYNIEFSSAAVGGIGYVSNCIMVAVLSGTSGSIIGIRMNRDMTYYIKNCIAIGFSGGLDTAIGFSNGDGTSTIYNCTAYNCNRGFVQAAGGTPTVKNCLADSCDNGFDGSFESPASNYNASSLSSDAPGANSINDYTTIFKDKTGGDYHLDVSDSRLRGSGTDLSEDSDLEFTNDIDRETRDHNGDWDIGADEYHSFVDSVFDHYIALNGTSDYITTPFSTVNDYRDAFDIRVKFAADDYTPSTVQTFFGKKGMSLTLTNTGRLHLYFTTNYVDWEEASTDAVGWEDGSVHWVRFTRSGTTVVIYDSPDGIDWTSIPVTTNTIPAGQMYSASESLVLGAFPGSGAEEFFAGKIYYLEAKDGIDGTTVLQFNASEIDNSETYLSNIDAEEKWTNNGGIYRPNYLMMETFEGTGYRESWTESGSGTIDEDSTSSPYVGSQCLAFTWSSGEDNITHDLGFDYSYISMCFAVNDTAASGSGRIIAKLLDSSDNIEGYLYWMTDNTVRVGKAGYEDDTVGTLGADWNFIWVDYNKATTTISVAFSTSDEIKPTSGDYFATKTNIPTPADIRKVQLASVVKNLKFDKVRVSDTEIGSNPI